MMKNWKKRDRNKHDYFWKIKENIMGYGIADCRAKEFRQLGDLGPRRPHIFYD